MIDTVSVLSNRYTTTETTDALDRSASSLRRLVRQGLSGELPCADETALEAFAAATQPGELAHELETMLCGPTREAVSERTLHACNA